MTELFAYAFMQRAFLAGVLIALTAGLLGTFMVQRRLSFLGDGLAHAAFGGMGIGAFVIVTSGLLATGGALLRNPMWIALPISLLVGLAIAYVKQRTDLSSDTTIGVFFAVSVAVGVLFFSRIPPDTPLGFDVMDLLFGSILAVRPAELAFIAFTAALACLILVTVWGKLAYATFDEELARTDGVQVRRLEYVLFAVAAAVVAVSSVVVGIVLMAAYLVIPAATARLLSLTLIGATVKAMVIGVVTTIAGIALSFVIDAPTGSTIILSQAFLFVVAMVVRTRLTRRAV